MIGTSTLGQPWQDRYNTTTLSPIHYLALVIGRGKKPAALPK